MILKLTDWQLAGYYPFTPLLAQSAEIGKASGCVTPVIPASVPGSVYRDLFRAGLIPDPYFDRNSLLCEWVKDRFWVYQTEFVPTAVQDENDRVLLHLGGIDYHAHIFVNGVRIGEHENMFVPFEADVTEQVRFGESNALRIVLENAPDEMGQIGYTERTHTQKARYTYKWDFCTRLVGMGLWGEAMIKVCPGARILATKALWQGGKLTYTAELDRPCRVKFALSFKGKLIAENSAELSGEKFKLAIPIEHPELWYPNGAGAQPLYQIKLQTLSEQGLVCDEKKESVGLRTLEYTRCAGAKEDALPYLPVINRKKIYIHGVNCVPMDLMTGCETAEKRRKMLTMVRDMGCNLVRVWGGGIIESDDFYSLCDELGLMIWQEMPQSSSGISNQPSKDPRFLSLIEKTAEYAAVARRNHVSLTFFSGGNELTDENGVPSTYEDENIAMLKQTLAKHAPWILMLPTSASGPTEYGLPDPDKNHDVHGPWKYGGPVAHYSRFNTSSIQLHSEFGTDGMANASLLPTFLSPEQFASIQTVASNLTWRHHGEWWDTYGYRDCPIFGDMGGDIETFITVSQYMQAESLRYAVESNRRRAWRCAGSIIWQFNEPWPNVAGTNLVDYALTPKLAYYFCRDAMKPFHASMRYDKLIWRDGEVFRGSVYLHDDRASVPAKPFSQTEDAVLTVTLLDEHRIPAAAFEEGDFSFRIDRLGRSFRLRVEITQGDRHDENEYLFFVVSDEKPHASIGALQSFVRGYLAKPEA